MSCSSWMPDCTMGLARSIDLREDPDSSAARSIEMAGIDAPMGVSSPGGASPAHAWGRRVSVNDADGYWRWSLARARVDHRHRNCQRRRNLSPYERTRLALRLEEAIAGRAKANQVRKPADFVSQKSAEQTHVETREEIAKLAGVSRACNHSASHERREWRGSLAGRPNWRGFEKPTV